MDKSIEIVKEVITTYNQAVRELAQLVKDNASKGESSVSSEQIIDILQTARYKIEAVMDKELNQLLEDVT